MGHRRAAPTRQRQRWNQLLGRIQVTGGTLAEERTFYSALYHSLLHPNVFDDANGDYIGFDDKVPYGQRLHPVRQLLAAGTSTASEVQLLALIAPRQTSDMVTSLLADAAQGGGLPKLPVANVESAQMNGDSADPFIASAYAFGARDFDVSRQRLPTWSKGRPTRASRTAATSERQDLAQYLAKGYVEADRTGSDLFRPTPWAPRRRSSTPSTTSPSRSWPRPPARCRPTERSCPAPRTGGSLVNPATGYLRRTPGRRELPARPRLPALAAAGHRPGRLRGGQRHPVHLERPSESARACSTRWAATARWWPSSTPSSPSSTPAAKQPYDWAGNEPSLGIPWEYDYAGAPWRTQDVVRRIVTTLYAPTPNGEPGNDDLGAMSSWYVWAALGLYPETPGRGELVLASPLFSHIKVTLSNERAIVIDAPKASAAAPFVQQLQIGGLTDSPCLASPAHGVALYSCPWLPSSVTQTGAHIEMTLGQSPNTAWGANPQDAPPSFAAR